MGGVFLPPPTGLVASERRAEEVPTQAFQHRRCARLKLFPRPRGDGKRLDDTPGQMEFYRGEVAALLRDRGTDFIRG